MPSGTLFVVATPIGNLEDITLRALRVLREADLVAAEDTRRTARLLAHHGIATAMLSFHAHNTRARVGQLIGKLNQGARVALVSDAGTPGISDPGLELIQACLNEGITVDPVPGPSATLAAAVASGFPLIPLTLYGFPPSRSKDRIRWLATVSACKDTWVFFESPRRIGACLRDAAAILGDRPIVVARELTKLHQEFAHGTAAALARRFATSKGEFTVVVGPARDDSREVRSIGDQEIAQLFGQITELPDTTRRSAVSAVAARVGRSPREVYAAIERAKQLGDTPNSDQ